MKQSRATTNARSSRPDFHPPYRKIADDLRGRIADGEFAPGGLLPGQRDLAKKYGVDVKTIQRSVQVLANDGVLVTEGWRGTFVRKHQMRDDIQSPSPQTGASALKHSPAFGVITYIDPQYKRTHLHDEREGPRIVNGIERAIMSLGGTSFFYNLSDQEQAPEAIRDIISTMAADFNIVGVVLVSPTFQFDVFKAARLSPVPSVVIEGQYNPAAVHQVYYDNREAGHRAASLLLNAGYDKLAYFAPFSDIWVTDRLEGARDAIVHRDLSVELLVDHAPQIIDVDSDYKELAASFAAAVKRESLEGVGVIACNDAAAAALMDHAAAFGLIAGSHYAIVGFDDSYLARDYGLTSLYRPIAAVSEKAVDMLFNLSQGVDCPMRICVNYEAVMRRSVRTMSEISNRSRADASRQQIVSFER